MKVKPQERTTYAVWEITLKCNLGCIHCGSRAGESRVNEMTTAEALDLAKQLAEVGIHEVTLIGGEAYLRHDWLQIAEAIAEAGMTCTMTTGGYGLSLATAKRMKEAGIARVSVSIDGLEATHDYLRGVKGSWKRCFKSLQNFRDAGLEYATNTQINRLSAPELPRLYEAIREAGIIAWQTQLTVPMGNAADNSDILLQPRELLDMYPMLAYLARRCIKDRIQFLPGNNIGYYGPYERLFRGGSDDANTFWMGCQAGLNVLGIEADGAIKGCPSLPTNAYTGGNIRDRSLKDIVLNAPELTFNVGADAPGGLDHLWGFCKGCEFALVCRGGCSWTAHVFFDKRGNNPYCHHRALEQSRRGLRERVRIKRQASGLPFDNGEFELFEEPMDSPWPEDDPKHFTADQIVWPDSMTDAPRILPANGAATKFAFPSSEAAAVGGELAVQAGNLPELSPAGEPSIRE